jgi:hypothetical protein
MQKVDHVVALVGALVLVAAVGVAATQELGGLAYAVAYAPIELPIPTFDFPSVLPTTGTTMDMGFALAGNVSLIEVNFTVTAVSPTEGSVRATLEADDGTVLAEQEAPVPAASQTPVLLSLSALVAPIPQPEAASYASEEAARAALVAGNGTSHFRVTFAYSPGLAPAAQARVEHSARVMGWVGVVVPIAPESR